MIYIIFIDETLEKNEIFNDWINSLNESIHLDYAKIKVLSDSTILYHTEDSIKKLVGYNIHEINSNPYADYVLYITCYQHNIKCIRELGLFFIPVYHYVPNFDVNDVKNIMERYVSEKKYSLECKYCPMKEL